MNTFIKLFFVAGLILLNVTFVEAQELAKVPSNFDVSIWARPTKNAPQPNIPRKFGEFPSACSISHIRFDDPIRMQGLFEQAPLHSFVGNTLTNANSTYASLRADGDGTCFGGPLNRSAIFFPTMMNAQGKAVLPDFVDVFYRGIASTKPFPRGLRMIFGYDPLDGYAWSAKGPRYGFSFGEGGSWWPASSGLVYKTLQPNLVPQWGWDNKAYRTSARAVSPDCWDGRNLDSADHKSHLAYSSNVDDSVLGACPTSHPVKIPQVTVTAYWRHIDRADVQGWYLSSDRFKGKTDSPGTNFYVGMIPAWDDDIMNAWVTKVLNTLYFGALGKLNDGRILELPPTSKTFFATKSVKNGYFLWSIETSNFPYGLPASYNNQVDPPAK
jgi:hypothetical protein